MNKYLVILIDALPESEIINFQSVISMRYVNVRAAHNFFILKTEDDAESIHKKIVSKSESSVEFMVVEFSGWFGSLYTSSLEWLREEFPDESFLDG